MSNCQKTELKILNVPQHATADGQMTKVIYWPKLQVVHCQYTVSNWQIVHLVNTIKYDFFNDQWAKSGH